MGMEDRMKPNRSNSGKADGIALLAFTILGFLTGWVVVEYLHNVYLQEYISGIIRSHGSFLTVALPSGILMGAAAVFLRGRSRRTEATLGRSQLLPMTVAESKDSHPLFLFDRPARDSKFLIRKTRSPGRISRIRAAERLPPGELA